MSTPTAIQMLAPPVGTTAREVCPKCGGGSDRESTLAITSASSGVFWHCFRSSCGYRGGPRGVRHPNVMAKAKEPRHYTRPYKALNDDQAAVIAQRFDLPSDVIDGYNEIDDRFILSVEGPKHQQRGVIAYSLSGGKPKSLTYNALPDEPFVHWAGSHHSKAIVVVEDWFSAEKVREADHHGVAIMGTNLTVAMVIELAVVAGNKKIPVYIALDKDAFAKAVGYVQKYREQFTHGLYTWALERDLKYVSVEDIKKAVEDGTRAEFTKRIPKGS